MQIPLFLKVLSILKMVSIMTIYMDIFLNLKHKYHYNIFAY